MEIKIKDDHIKLGQALKLAGLVGEGSDAKAVIKDGLVKVNGEAETRRGRKVLPGDTISFDGKDVTVIGAARAAEKKEEPKKADGHAGRGGSF